MHRFAAAAVAATAVTLVAAPVAMPHAGLVATNPANGASVRALPTTVTLTFSGVLARAGRVTVIRNGVNYVRSARLNPRDAAQVRVVTRGGRVKGVYRVRWVVTHVDGHQLTGTFSFRVR